MNLCPKKQSVNALKMICVEDLTLFFQAAMRICKRKKKEKKQTNLPPESYVIKTNAIMVTKKSKRTLIRAQCYAV